ncbi:hypothetical protein BD769DRAFT_1439637 [Suillus cothurnatus]|nr:hypothetical protein BD769DRAFT_1439637 [Suillus cothurnatus]
MSIQDQTRQEVTQACAEAREMRQEWDEAVKALHEKQEASAQQSAVEQAKLTIKYHTETIAQLHYKSKQWKQQGLHLEDTSCQEATIWKEQFLRVEQKRYKLAMHVDKLIGEQLSHTVQTHTSITPSTTMLCFLNTTPSTILSDPTASTCHCFPPYTSELPDESISTSSSRAFKSIATQQLPMPISANHRTSRDRPKHMENPISDEVLSASSYSAWSLSSSSLGSASTILGSSRSTLSISSKTMLKSSKPTSAPSKTGQSTNKIVLATSKSASLNNKPTSVASTKSAPPPSKSTARPSKPTLSGTSNKLLPNPAGNKDGEDKISEQCKSGSDATAKDEIDSSEEEDDELTLGAEENCRKVYGTKYITATSSIKAVSQVLVKKKKLIPSTTTIIMGDVKKPPVKSARR